jgi:hypothetical protein
MELTFGCTMRGEDKKQSSMLMLMSPETRVPATHPLRAIKKAADQALESLSPTFDAMYAESGRPSIPPERLLKSMLLMRRWALNALFPGHHRSRGVTRSGTVRTMQPHRASARVHEGVVTVTGVPAA